MGWARTPYTRPTDCPRQPLADGPLSRIELLPRYEQALLGMTELEAVVVLAWLDRADRDRLRVTPRPEPARGERGVFALRSPDRPNPIGVSGVPLVGVQGAVVTVRGLDLLDGTPVIDLKHPREERPG